MTEVKPSTADAIYAEAIVKTFGVHDALRGVDLAVGDGERVMILGPNGAGKTTLLKILSTIMNPTSGKLFVFGQDVKSEAESIRRRIGVVSHQSFFYSSLTIHENLEFYARMYDVPDRNQRIQEIIEMVGMTPRLDDRTNTLSRGMQQRISIARALLHDPDVVLLDEPETGLDQQALYMLWKLLLDDPEKKRTVIVSTHNLERVLEFADSVVILCRGNVVYHESAKGLTLPELRQAYAEKSVDII